MRRPALRVYAGFALAVMGLASSAAWPDARDAAMHDVRSQAEPGRTRDASPSGHVPPAPPSTPMPRMSPDEMIEAMAMDDGATFARLRLDRFERTFGADVPLTAWDFDAWIGRDFDKLRIRSEGKHARGGTEEADVEALWSHAVATFWDSELGVRRDVGRDGRTWLAVGLQGLAPYWFEIGATAYVADGARTALRVEADYDIALTQRLILQPRAELNAYGRSDRRAGVGAGLSGAELGLRLRYQIRREFAPYVGLEWSRRFGRSADFAREERFDANDMRWVVGVRAWY